MRPSFEGGIDGVRWEFKIGAEKDAIDKSRGIPEAFEKSVNKLKTCRAAHVEDPTGWIELAVDGRSLSRLRIQRASRPFTPWSMTS